MLNAWTVDWHEQLAELEVIQACIDLDGVGQLPESEASQLAKKRVLTS